MEIHVGTCGWSYLNAKKYLGNNWKQEFKSKLQAYASLFQLVEINSTFYRAPRLSTVKKWRDEADEINPDFEFTVKCSRTITHDDRFSSEASVSAFNLMKQIAKILRAKILLFQTPASFKPTESNIRNAKKFFRNIDKEDFILVWEVRWENEWKKEIVKNMFSELGLNQCVDPLRQDCFCAEELIYYRLHGFGERMYNYQFSMDELRKLVEITKSKKKDVYVLFNNVFCFEDAMKFASLWGSSSLQ